MGHFVQMAYNKQCPLQMYNSVCQRYKCNPSKGINWRTIKELYIQSNDSPSSKLIHSKQSVSTSDILQSQSSKSQCSNSTKSSSASPRSPHALRRIRRSRSADTIQIDTASMVVDVIDKQNQNLSEQLFLERKKRKRSSSVVKSLKFQIDVLRDENNNLQSENAKLKTENESLQDQLIHLKHILNNNRARKSGYHLERKSATVYRSRRSEVIAATGIAFIWGSSVIGLIVQRQIMMFNG